MGLKAQNVRGIGVATVKLRIAGLPQKADTAKESIVNASNLQEIIRSIEIKYPEGYYTFSIFVNGVGADPKSINLHDGDEVVIVPVMSGG
jgi:molybdopterin converting factor small subunit